MENSILLTLSWKEIADLLHGAKSRIRVVIPSIHMDWFDILEKAAEKNIDIEICINNSEKSIRDGYGDHKAIRKVLGLPIKIHETDRNRIGLISVDNSSFLYFSTSRIFEEGSDKNNFNAVKIDTVTAAQIMYFYFPNDTTFLKNLLKDEVLLFDNAHDQIKKFKNDISLNNLPKLSCNFNSDTFRSISERLDTNPPLEPDLKREIEVYNLKVQFVELRFENGKISGRRVNIPRNALPIDSPDLKRIMDAGMRIFTDAQQKIDSYTSIQEEVKITRERYLIPIKCRPEKSIIEKIRKDEFQFYIDAINNRIKNQKIELISKIDDEIEKSKYQLKEELKKYYHNKPPEGINGNYFGEQLLKKIDDFVGVIVSRMDFPKAHKMVDGMKLTVRYYDLTPDDFNDEELLGEFEEKRILKGDIESIRHMRAAFEARNIN